MKSAHHSAAAGAGAFAARRPARRTSSCSRPPTCTPWAIRRWSRSRTWARSSSAATKGRLSVQMYPSMQLGGEKEAIEQAQVGAIAFARVRVGALGPVVDDLNVFNLPFLFRNTAHMQKVIDGPIGQELLDKVTNNPKGPRRPVLDGCRRAQLLRHQEAHQELADLKGQKIRVMGNPMFVDMTNSMGGNGVALGYDQVFTSLQTGVVDGAENNPPSFVFDNHYQVAKYYTIDRTPDRPGNAGVSKRSGTRCRRTSRPWSKSSPVKRRPESASYGMTTRSRRWPRSKPPASRSSGVRSPTRSRSRTRSSRCGTSTAQIRRHDQAIQAVK